MSTEHAVVVGAGMGGMAAAIRLRARGYRVTLLEANERLEAARRPFTARAFGLMVARLLSPHRTSSTSFSSWLGVTRRTTTRCSRLIRFIA